VSICEITRTWKLECIETTAIGEW